MFDLTNQWLYSCISKCINKHKGHTQTIPLLLLHIVSCSYYIKSWTENQTECWHIQKCVGKGASISVVWKYHKYFHWINKIIIKKIQYIILLCDIWSRNTWNDLKSVLSFLLEIYLYRRNWMGDLCPHKGLLPPLKSELVFPHLNSILEQGLSWWIFRKYKQIGKCKTYIFFR